jgi:hypothetical protein
MISSKKFQNGQTVVIFTGSSHRVGKVINSRNTTSKGILYDVLGEDGKLYDKIPNQKLGSYRIDSRLTKIFCEAKNINTIATDTEIEQLQKQYIAPESDILPYLPEDPYIEAPYTKQDAE